MKCLLAGVKPAPRSGSKELKYTSEREELQKKEEFYVGVEI